jgi:hypothetical protein
MRKAEGLSLAATNRLHIRQYDSIRGDMPRTGRCSNRGAGDFENIGFGKVLRIVTQRRKGQQWNFHHGANHPSDQNRAHRGPGHGDTETRRRAGEIAKIAGIRKQDLTSDKRELPRIGK